MKPAHQEGHTRALILANGEPPSVDLLRRLAGDADVFVAADGAANRLASLGLQPDIVIGDFDSLAPAARADLPDARFLDASSQERCDLEKAIEHVLGLGADEIVIAGATGGRFDHTLTAAALLVHHAGSARIRMVGDGWECEPATSSVEITGRAGDTVSLIAFAPTAGVTFTGVRWPLRGEYLAPDSRGVSNEMTGDRAVVTVERGTLLVCHIAAEAARR